MDHSLGSSFAAVLRVRHGTFLRLHRTRAIGDIHTWTGRNLEHFVPWNGQPSVSSTQDDTHITIDQRKEEFIPKSVKVMDSCYLVNKMTILLRRLELREPDGAVAWENLLMHFESFTGDTHSLEHAAMDRLLGKGTNIMRFRISSQCTRQSPACELSKGHSGGVRVDPTLQNHVELACG